MRVVLQRASRGRVTIDGSVTGEIGSGLVLLVGFTDGDDDETLDWMAEKILGLRIFSDEEGKMNLSLEDTGGDLLVISQFTLYGSLRKGTRPSFNRAADPAMAIPMYESFVANLERLTGKPVATGIFGAEMMIEAHNDGPVTLVLDTQNKDF